MQWINSVFNDLRVVVKQLQNYDLELEYRSKKGYIIVGNEVKVRAVDRIVELCERDLAFIWLTKGQKPKRDSFYEFKNKKLTADVLDELNYQFFRRLQKEGFITLKSVSYTHLDVYKRQRYR